MVGVQHIETETVVRESVKYGSYSYADDKTVVPARQYHPLDLVYLRHYDPELDEYGQVPIVALYAKYMGDSREWGDVMTMIGVVVDVASIAFGIGALAQGAKGLLRVAAIMDVAISSINLTLTTADVKQELSRSAEGCWLLSHWGLISLGMSAGLLSTYLVRGILRNGPKALDNPNLSPALREELEHMVKQAEVAAMAKPPKVGSLGGSILRATDIRQLKGTLKQKGIVLFLEDEVRLLKNKQLIKQFKPVVLDNLKFDNATDFFYYMRKRGFAGAYDAKTKQMFLTENPTEYLAFHEMSHVKHFEELGEAYHTLPAWEKETYVFLEIWKKRHLWTKEELKHSLKYVNDVREKSGQALLNYKL